MKRHIEEAKREIINLKISEDTPQVRAIDIGDNNIIISIADLQPYFNVYRKIGVLEKLKINIDDVIYLKTNNFYKNQHGPREYFVQLEDLINSLKKFKCSKKMKIQEDVKVLLLGLEKYLNEEDKKDEPQKKYTVPDIKQCLVNTSEAIDSIKNELHKIVILLEEMNELEKIKHYTISEIYDELAEIREENKKGFFRKLF